MLTGRRLRELREHFRLSQVEMSVRLGIGRVSYSQMETGKTKMQEEVAYRLYDVFHCNLNWLFTGQGAMLLDQKPLSAADSAELGQKLEACREESARYQRKYIEALEELNGMRKRGR